MGSISTFVDLIPRKVYHYGVNHVGTASTLRWLCLGLGALSLAGCSDMDRRGSGARPSEKVEGLTPVVKDPSSTQSADGQSSDAEVPGTLPKDDTGQGPQGDPNGCGDQEPYDFSLIWVANSPEGTVSKIDTRTAKEIARYRTGPMKDANPSRTSVSLQGFVAVANRKGSVTVIAPREGKCVDRNGDGKIQTSRSAMQVLDWGEDECVLWNHQLDVITNGKANTGGPRAVAWGLSPGGKDPCGDERADLWVGYRDQPRNEVIIKKLSAKGELLDQARVTNWQGNWGHGLYGGAIDPQGDFWGLGTRGTLVRVDAVTMEVDRYEYNEGEAHIPYGMGIDRFGRVWTGGHKNGRLVYFDPKTESFQTVSAAMGSKKRYRGIAVGQDDQIWVAVNNECGLAHYDAKQKAWKDPLIKLPGCQEPVGVAIDPQGRIWVVDKGADRAYRVDPKTSDLVQVQGLKSPYSYSDMTGSGLRLVEDPPV